MFYKNLDDNDIRCLLCPHQCLIKNAQTGRCRVRRNQDGKLIAGTYGVVSAAAMDPIEKKPLYHFFPGSEILSLGQAGCTFDCDFCQNYHMLNPSEVRLQKLEPRQAVELALRENAVGIAYTYNEPWVGYEYVLDIAGIAHQNDLKNVLVTNGYYSQPPFEKLAPFIDAMNIDLKSIHDSFYQHYSKGKLSPVQKTIEKAFESGIHIEITNLLITDVNDSSGDIVKLAEYIAGISEEIPLHISRYRPAYKMNRPPTSIDKMREAYRIASSKLKYVYLGNLVEEGFSDTVCPQCDSLLVARRGFSADIVNLSDGYCEKCGKKLNFIT